MNSEDWKNIIEYHLPDDVQNINLGSNNQNYLKKILEYIEKNTKPTSKKKNKGKKVYKPESIKSNPLGINQDNLDLGLQRKF